MTPHTLDEPHGLRIMVSRRSVAAAAIVLVFVAGTLFSSAALAAGIDSPDLLALVFAFGATTTLFVLLVWYVAQLPPARGTVASSDDIERGPPWTPSQRPPSGSTIMWAASALRRATGGPSLP